MAIKKHPSKPGNPSDFTLEDHKRIIEAYKDTIVMSNVAGLCRRDVNTIKSWMNSGQSDHINNLDTELARFFIDVRETLAKTILSMEKKLLRTSKGWQRYAWYLERCARQDYSQYGDVIDRIEEMLMKLKTQSNKNIAGFDQEKSDILAQVKKLQRDGQGIEAKNDNTAN